MENGKKMIVKIRMLDPDLAKNMEQEIRDHILNKSLDKFVRDGYNGSNFHVPKFLCLEEEIGITVDIPQEKSKRVYEIIIDRIMEFIGTADKYGSYHGGLNCGVRHSIDDLERYLNLHPTDPTPVAREKIEEAYAVFLKRMARTVDFEEAVADAKRLEKITGVKISDEIIQESYLVILSEMNLEKTKALKKYTDINPRDDLVEMYVEKRRQELNKCLE